MDKISVIVPVYNAQGTLERCLRSLINQNRGGQLFEYQIVVINDGSTDNSLDILDSYARKCERIKVLDKINEGPAAARKYGIENSDSDYLAFCDSDDYVDSDWLLTLYSYLKKYDADISRVMAYLNDRDTHIEYKEPYEVWEWNRNESILKFIEHIQLNGTLMTCLFKRELFKGLEWNLSMKTYEDDFLVWQIISKIKKIVKVRVQKYHYMFNPESLTNRHYDQNRYYSYKVITNRIVDDCSKGNLAVYKNEALAMQYVWTFRTLYMMITSPYYNDREEKEMVKMLWRNFFLYYKNINGIKDKISAILLMISPNFSRKLYKMIKKTV